ncbi:MAG: Ig-like domain-containing protein [Candidatus Ratteibacteria bacterium]|jgi:hypothetical protein
MQPTRNKWGFLFGAFLFLLSIAPVIYASNIVNESSSGNIITLHITNNSSSWGNITGISLNYATPDGTVVTGASQYQGLTPSTLEPGDSGTFKIQFSVGAAADDATGSVAFKCTPSISGFLVDPEDWTDTVTVQVQRPKVSSWSPTGSSVSPAGPVNVSIGFDKAMDTSTVSASISPDSLGSANWSGNSSVSYEILTSNPNNNLQCGVDYTVTVSGQALDGHSRIDASNSPNNPGVNNSFSWTFHTSCPQVKEVYPKRVISSANAIVRVTFSDPVAPMDKESTQ